ncbi:MAG: hypothetical protein HKN91_02765 [Acidimicrobiia bacterium]|nr:hypothetical protein [Acidimicrobiia bacterium]
MKRIAGLLVLLLLLAACGGGSDGDDRSDDPGGGNSTAAPEGSSTSDGTRLIVPGAIGGVDIVDLDEESQEPFIESDATVNSLRLIGNTLWFVDGTDLVAANPANGDIIGRTAMPDGVADIAVAGDTAWVLTGIIGASSAVAVVDVDSMTQTGSITAPEFTTYLYIAALGADAWAFGGNLESAAAVSKLDPASMTQTTSVDIGIIADSMIGAHGAIWVGGTIPAFVSASGAPESGVAKLDPTTGDVLLTLELGAPDDHTVVAAGFGHVWVTKGLDGTLYKLDPATGETVDSVDTGSGAAGIPLEIIFTEDLVWVFNTTENTATGYDPDSLELEDGINVPAFAPAPIFAP